MPLKNDTSDPKLNTTNMKKSMLSIISQITQAIAVNSHNTKT